MIQKKTFIGTLLVAGCLPLIASAQSGTTGQGSNGQGKTGQAPHVGTGSPSGMDHGDKDHADKMAANEHGRLALQRSDKIIGTDVMDQSGSKIGRIDDLILRQDGTIGYAIISGNEPDTMAKEYPIPWKLVHVDMASNAERSGEPKAGADRAMAADRYTLKVDKSQLVSAPSFDRTQWPKGGDAGIYTESERFFGSSAVAGTPDPRTGRPIEAGASNPTYFRASQMRNQSVNDAAGMPIGTLGQLVIDPVQGRVNYATFSTSSTAGAVGRTVALPWQTIRASQRDQKDSFELTVPQDRLQGAPEFKNGDENWKHMSDPKYVHEMYGYYSVRPYWNDKAAGQGRKTDAAGKEGGVRDTPHNDGADKNGNDPKRGNNTGGSDGGKDSGQGGRNNPPH